MCCLKPNFGHSRVLHENISRTMDHRPLNFTSTECLPHTTLYGRFIVLYLENKVCLDAQNCKNNCDYSIGMLLVYNFKTQSHAIYNCSLIVKTVLPSSPVADTLLVVDSPSSWAAQCIDCCRGLRQLHITPAPTPRVRFRAV